MVDFPTLEGIHRDVVVIGGGQAGLSASQCLTGRRIEHLVVERDRVGSEWRNRRWDSFCLVTPNWQCQLPGFPYQGDDPDGFMLRDDIVRYIEDYAESFDVPLVEKTAVTRLRSDGKGLFILTTSQGTMTAEQVVLATGPYQLPAVPRLAERLPENVVQLHSSQYRGASQLPDGDVLVVGTGQSGCQVAEDLHLVGRRVHLSVGSAPRISRFYRGRDVVAWLDSMGYYQKTIDDLADGDAVRARANHYVTGRGGGHDIDLRAFAVEGMKLYGRLQEISSGRLQFDDDLGENLDHADQVSDNIKDSIDDFIRTNGIDAPTEARYQPVWKPAGGTDSLNASNLAAVVWSTGFTRDYSWIELPLFNGQGYPTHRRGVTSFPGLYVLGLPWLHTWGSGRFSGVAADAEYLADRVVSYRTGRRVGRDVAPILVGSSHD
jgi:putative flavoprotein involved in K+ transport